MAATYYTTPLAAPPLNASELPAEYIPQTQNNGESSSSSQPVQTNPYGASSSRPVPETPPAIPPRPVEYTQYGSPQGLPPTSQFQPPPKRNINGAGNITRPVEYSRDPERLIAYLVPFPTPDLREGFLQTVDPVAIPSRFLIYTPLPPPLLPPKTGEKKERKVSLHYVQRKWQGEVRAAKTSDVDKKSWRGLRYKGARGVDQGIGWITTSNLDFLCRIPKDKKLDKKTDKSSTTTAPVNGDGGNVSTSGSGRLDELVLVHPQSLPGTADEVQREFINSLQRSKKRAYRDTVISVVLFPIAIAIDTVAVIIWPFGGLAEIDGVWAVCSIRGAKRARSVTKRLDSHPSIASDEQNTNGQNTNGQNTNGQNANEQNTNEQNSDPNNHAKRKKHKKQKKPKDKKLKLTFTPTERLEILRRYLAFECHKRDPKLFKHAGDGTAPTESQVLEALGWAPSGNTTVGEKRNNEDEQWEIHEAKEDLQRTMKKGAKEWAKWCKTFQKKPEKALKK